MQSYFAVTHTAPPGGLTAWTAPDPNAPMAAQIQPRVEMRVLEHYGDWAHIECTNGWRAWVDGRSLVPIHAARPGPPPRGPKAASPLNPAITTIGRYTMTLADLVPAVALVLGSLLPWLRGGLGRNNGFHVPVTFLFHSTAGDSPIKVGILLAVLALVAAFAPSQAIRLGAYAIALIALVLYVIRVGRLLHQAQAGVGITSVLGAGVYISIVAGGLGLIWTLVRRA